MFSRILILSLPALLAGCISLDPDYQRPVAPVPATLPYSTASSSKAADIPWQETIIDPKLRQVIALALESNRDLRQAIADIEAARAQYGVQRAAQIPTVNAGVNGSRGRGLSDTSDGNNNTAISQSYGAQASVSAFELDLFGKKSSLSHAEFETYLATEEAAKTTRITLIADTATAWVTLAADQNQLLLAEETLKSAEQSLKLAQLRQKNGIASRIDVAAMETLYQSARADVAQYKTTVAQDKNALDLLVGQPVAAHLLPVAASTLPEVIKAVPVGLSSDVLLNRPDVLEAEHKLKSANANIGAARAAFFPSVTLTASGGVSSSALSTLLSEGAGIWSLAPAITLPIFDGGANRAALEYSQAQKTGYIAAYEKAIQTAFKEVADALARKATIQEQRAAQQAYVAAAQESVEPAQKRYKQGIDTYLNMLDAQRTLYAAQTRLIAVQQIQTNNLITLYKVLGGGVSDVAKE